MKKTLKRKLNPKGKHRRMVKELKANATSFEVKEYFFRQLSGVRFGLYALTLNKDRLYPELQKQKDRIYNYLARLILDQLPLENASDAVNLVLDQRKNRRERQEFNDYIKRELASRLPPGVRLRITHEDSVNNHCLQAVDLFCWGIFRKYEREDNLWFDLFQGKVRYHTL